jgi:hypothetical protein
MSFEFGSNSMANDADQHDKERSAREMHFTIQIQAGPAGPGRSSHGPGLPPEESATVTVTVSGPNSEMRVGHSRMWRLFERDW